MALRLYSTSARFQYLPKSYGAHLATAMPHVKVQAQRDLQDTCRALIEWSGNRSSAPGEVSPGGSYLAPSVLHQLTTTLRLLSTDWISGSLEGLCSPVAYPGSSTELPCQDQSRVTVRLLSMSSNVSTGIISVGVVDLPRQ
jgi:hypothetical protein